MKTKDLNGKPQAQPGGSLEPVVLCDRASSHSPHCAECSHGRPHAARAGCCIRARCKVRLIQCSCKTCKAQNTKLSDLKAGENPRPPLSSSDWGRIRVALRTEINYMANCRKDSCYAFFASFMASSRKREAAFRETLKKVRHIGKPNTEVSNRERATAHTNTP